MVYYANIISDDVSYFILSLERAANCILLQMRLFLCVKYRILLELFCYNDKITL